MAIPARNAHFFGTRITHSVLGLYRRVWEHAPPGKVFHLDHMRVLLRLSETTITVQNSWQLYGAPSVANLCFQGYFINYDATL